MAYIEHKCILKVPVTSAFDYVVDQSNRTQWLDSVLEVKDISPGAVGEGTSWKEKQKVAGRIIDYVATITEYDPPHKWAMNMGIPGGKGVLTNSFEPKDDGTLMTMTIDYILPGALFGRLADKILFERIAAKTARQNSATLKMVLESEGK
jgi:uncharacterized protein YndB with AHSA1/START domain